MASRQQFKEDRAEAAAKLAAKDIGDINRTNERDEGYDLHDEANFKQARAEAAAKLAAKDLEDANRLRDNTFNTWKEQHQHDENKPGVIGSMFRAAKEAVVGKPHHEEVYAKETKMGEYSDYATQKARETKQKAGEYTDYAAQKAKETKDYAAEKAKNAKDTTVQKAGEYKDYTAEKAIEGKDSAVGKLGELKESAADAAKRAMGFFTGGNKDQTREEEEETRRSMQEVRVQDKEYGTGRGTGEKLVIKMEESRPGAVADALKAANRAMDGDMEEEGVLHVERRREKM
ncbi:embryonic protein DC-8-like isoform X2 [Glycine soja]|uniref:embryonic protein DC-8-like isoform X2 n=1 Tax=Glycine soja TaxID=3848 RepID=UPI00103CF7D5|nr:embryonic protein DC-8-like isoform X2 [Glycine soja]